METGKVEYGPDYTIRREVSAICPNCGNPDCAEVEEFKKQVLQRDDKRLFLSTEWQST